MDVLKSRPALTAGLVSLPVVLLLVRALHHAASSSSSSSSTSIIASPRTTLLPHLSPAALALLPYPPDALPGGRDVATPHGTIRVFEFGPLAGERVLLLPGISTPCIAFANLAAALVRRGYRVMLFDYFGRGWSDTPDPEPNPNSGARADHDEKLYVTQILYVLASSGSNWLGDAKSPQRNGGGLGSGGFHVMGYSFGGGLAACFASYFPHAVRSVTLVAPGGLMPWRGNSWRTWLLYFAPRGLFPRWVLRYFVRRRFKPVVPSAAQKQQRRRRQRREGENGGGDDDAVLAEQAETRTNSFNDAVVATRKRVVGGDGDGDETQTQTQTQVVNVTVADVMAWQVRHHHGFIPAVMSAFRHGPIHERYEEWGRLGELLAARRRRPRSQPAPAPAPAREEPGGKEEEEKHGAENRDNNNNNNNNNGKRRQQQQQLATKDPLPGLLGGKVLLVLGGSDPIVREEWLVPEMTRVLGEGAFDVVVLDAGHEVAITKGSEIASAAVEFWDRCALAEETGL